MTFRIQKSWRWLVAATAVFVPGIVSGALALPFTFSAGTAIKAADVNANFEALRARLDAISVPGTGLPPVVGTLTIPGVLSGVSIRKFSQSILGNTATLGGGATAPVLSLVEVTRDLGTGTPQVVSALNQGQVQKLVTIVMGNLTVKLNNAVVLGLKTAPALGGHPQEVIAFNFGSIEWDYTPPGKPTQAVTYDRIARTGGGNPRTNIKYAAAAPGVTVDATFIPVTDFTQSNSCPAGSTTIGTTCSGKLSFGVVNVQKPMGPEVTDELARLLSNAVVPSADLQWFSAATTVNNRILLTNATVTALNLTSNDDGSFSESLDLQWQKAQFEAGGATAVIDRSVTGT